MKRIKLLSTLALVLVAALVGIGESQAGSLHKIRPLTLKVIDAQTKQPLEGIVVYYIVVRRTMRTSRSGELPAIEPTVGYSVESKMTAHTDQNGEVRFQEAQVYLRSYWFRSRADLVHSETMFINLEPSEKRKQISPKEIQNDPHQLLFSGLPFLRFTVSPNEEYKGYQLVNTDIARSHGEEESHFTFDVRQEDFISEAEAFIQIELQPRLP